MNKVTDKRSALLQAALELFAEHGFNGSSTALIAKQAGVARVAPSFATSKRKKS